MLLRQPCVADGRPVLIQLTHETLQASKPQNVQQKESEPLWPTKKNAEPFQACFCLGVDLSRKSLGWIFTRTLQPLPRSSEKPPGLGLRSRAWLGSQPPAPRPGLVSNPFWLGGLEHQNARDFLLVP